MQSYCNFELIIVNDGSRDNTEEVLNTLKSTDSRIKIVNKPNGGVSSARNAGIEVASGEFVIFVDDDDNIGKDYIKSLMDVDPDIDLVIDSFSDQVDDSPIIPVDFPEIKIEGREEILDFIFGEMQNYRYCFFPYAKRFRLRILKNYNIRFPENITLGEDRLFVLDYIRYANSMQMINSHNYIVKQTSDAAYRLSHGVIPSDFLIRNFRDAHVFLINYSKEYNNPLVLKYADNNLAHKVINYLLIRMCRHRYSEDSENHIIKDVPTLLRNIKVDNVKNKRNRMIVRMVRFLGVQPTVMIMNLAFKVRSK